MQPLLPLSATLATGLLLVAGLAKAVADSVAHGSPRLFIWFPNWAAEDSWRNKYRNRDPTQGPRFWLSTTLLVALTDLWHLANLVQWLAADAALLLTWGGPWRWWAVAGIVARRLVFQPVYSWLRK